ncbi:hypothetical protein, partial [Oleiphilus sp. HI0061]
EFTKAASTTRLAELAQCLGLGSRNDNDTVLAEAFISEVKNLISTLNIENTIPQIKRSDFSEIIQGAFKEANSTYAVAKYMSYDEAEEMLSAISGRASDI